MTEIQEGSKVARAEVDHTFAELAAMDSGRILDDGYENGVRYIIMRGPGSLCAYVGVPLDHPLAGFDYDSISLECHGGLTFASEGKGSFPLGWFWFGWDYSHLGDLSFYDLDRPGRDRGDHGWTVRDVRGEIWSVTYEFAKLCRIVEAVGRRTPALSSEDATRPTPTDKCPYCAGEGWRTEYVGSRFLGSEPAAHATTVKCWACGGSGRLDATRPTGNKE